jgi:uroporphyrinogen decarboxylase
MTARERVKRAIHFHAPDRLPQYLPDGEENDLLWLWFPRPAQAQTWKPSGDSRERCMDEWGVVWERAGGSGLGEAVQFPIQDVTRQSEYRFPDLNDAAKYIAETRPRVIENDASLNPKYCLGVLPFNSLNEGTHSIMGLQNMFAAYYENPAALKALIGRLAEKQKESIRLLAGCGLDGVMGYDDWGLQDRLMVNPEMIEEFFLPHYRENWALAHQLGMDVWLHSCGYIIDILPLFAEAGLNVIQMDQQENMGLERLDRRAGGRIAFWCPVDIQNTMVRGSVDDVRCYVRRMLKTLGGHAGGLVSMAYSDPKSVGHSEEKVAAMCAAFRHYGAPREYASG